MAGGKVLIAGAFVSKGIYLLCRYLRIYKIPQDTREVKVYFCYYKEEKE